MDYPYYLMKATFFAETSDEKIGLEKLKNAVELSSRVNDDYHTLTDVFNALGINSDGICTYYRFEVRIEDDALHMEGLFYMEPCYVTFEALARALKISHVASGDVQQYEEFINTDAESRFLKDQYALSFMRDKDWWELSQEYPLHVISTFNDFETLADVVAFLKEEEGVAIHEDAKEDMERINEALAGTMYKIYKRVNKISYIEECERALDAFAKEYWSKNSN